MTGIDERVRDFARTQPDRVAVIGTTTSITWGELDAAADRAAAFLAGRGVGPGDRVGWLGRNDVAYPVLLLGAWRRRAVLAGLNWRLDPSELRPVLDSVEPALLVADARSAALAEPDHVVPDGGLPWSEGPIDPGAILAPEPGDAALLFFTSGSTGAPKGVLLDRGPNDACYTMPMPFAMAPSSTALIVPPVFHVAGSCWVQMALASGTTQLFLADAAPASIVRALRYHRVTHALMVPTLIKTVLDELSRTGANLPDLRHIAYGGMPIPRPLLESAVKVLAGVGFTQAYGLTEAGGLCAHLEPSDHVLDDPDGRLGATGRPIPGVRFTVVRPGTDEECAPGEQGEVLIGSDFMMRGYWRDPARTGAALDASGRLRSGDLGHLDEAGYLHIAGRADDMIITGGENVHPAETERTIMALPGVVETAVFGVPDEHWGQRVCAAVVTDAGLAPDEVIGFCRSRMAHYKCPSEVIVVPSLPRTPTGKISKSRLRGLAAP
ncbi:class I adenylate-forming enzyme family protein [Actinomadura nitritigenes]|uniref:class I adenylate-forming enzyme family protein n=1 Tax=Actinomadura nitritigenes TaxID=134602 RepID=UPI003D91E5D1